MSQSNSSSNAFGWKAYKNATPELKKAFLNELDLDRTLPLVTWEGQVDILHGAPDEVIIQYMPKLYWKAQVVMFEKHLSVSAHEDAVPHLDILAKRYLKIQVPVMKKRRWHYKV